MDPSKVTVLVTGGAGYIGSHAVVKLLENGNKVVVVDNCSNCYKDPAKPEPECLTRAQILAGKSLKFRKVDLLDSEALDNVFKAHKIDCVMHFAALKSVGESCEKPLQYYRNNVVGTLNLLDAMAKANCFRLIYSSSATVYGDPVTLPLDENSATGDCSNPYGATKHTTESIMKSLCASDNEWKIISLRYFNPVGAHESGRIGEDPSGIPNNLMPYIAQVAVGKLNELKVYGNDYPTKDGTGVRDYIHIQDLANGHTKALEKLFDDDFHGFRAYNLGTGAGHSVLEVIKAFEAACGKPIKYRIVGRREGDVASSYCDCRLANTELDWVATKTLQEMCEDMWRWQQMNPNGYAPLKPDATGTCKCNASS